MARASEGAVLGVEALLRAKHDRFVPPVSACWGHRSGMPSLGLHDWPQHALEAHRLLMPVCTDGALLVASQYAREYPDPMKPVMTGVIPTPQRMKNVADFGKFPDAGEWKGFEEYTATVRAMTRPVAERVRLGGLTLPDGAYPALIDAVIRAATPLTDLVRVGVRNANIPLDAAHRKAVEEATFNQDVGMLTYEGMRTEMEALALVAVDVVDGFPPGDREIAYFDAVLASGIMEQIAAQFPFGLLGNMVRDGFRFNEPLVVRVPGATEPNCLQLNPSLVWQLTALRAAFQDAASKGLEPQIAEERIVQAGTGCPGSPRAIQSFRPAVNGWVHAAWDAAHR